MQISLDEGSTLASLTTGALGFSSSSTLPQSGWTIANDLAQAAATAAAGVAVLAPKSVKLTAVSAGFSCVGVWLGLKQLSGPDFDNLSATDRSSQLKCLGDAMTVMGDAFGVLAPLSFKFPTIKAFLSAANALLSGVGLALAAGQFTADQIASVTAAANNGKGLLSGLGQSGIDMFGAGWTQTATPLVNTLTDLAGMIAAVNTGTYTDFKNALNAFISDAQSAENALYSLAGLSTTSAPNITISSTSSDAVSITTSDNSFTGSAGLSCTDGLATGDFSFSQGILNTVSGTDQLSANGLETQVFTAQGGADQATQTVAIDPSTGQANETETTFDDVPITATDGVALELDTTGTLAASIGASNLNDSLTLQTATDGSGDLSLDWDTGSASQNVILYNPVDLSDDTIDISNSGSDAVVNTAIGAGGYGDISSDSSVAGVTQDVTFTESGDTVELADPAGFVGTIYNFQPGDTIALDGIYANSASIGAGGLLTVQNDDGSTLSLQLDPSQDYSNYQLFTDDYDAAGGSDIVAAPIQSDAAPASITVNATVEVYDSISNTWTNATYSADVGFSATTLQFSPVRDIENFGGQEIIVGVSLVGGDLDPNAGDNVGVFNESTSSNYTVSGVDGLGPDNPNGTIDVGSFASTPGENAETLPLAVSYDGASDELDLSVSSPVYATAIPSFSVDGTQYDYNLGIIHVGQTASADVAIANLATGALADTLIANQGTVGEFVADTGASIAAGDTGTVEVTVVGDVAGVATADQTLFGLASHDSVLPDAAPITDDLAYDGNSMLLEASVYNYAAPVLVAAPVYTPGQQAGTLTQTGADSYNLDFGTIVQSSTGFYFGEVFIANTAPAEYSDSLAGSLTTSGSGFGDYAASGAIVSEPGGAAYDAMGAFSPDLTMLGANTVTVVLQPTSVDTSGTTELPDITLTVTDDVVACFLPGTQIATPGGDCPVERLREGDMVLTAGGGAARLRWIGTGKALATRGRRGPATPVIVRKGALGDNIPYRDLYVTKGHSLFIDGVLIPVEFLVNHRSILWDDRAQEVTVYHLELDRHDVLLANGAAAESYRDDGNRFLFQNANSGWSQTPRMPCAPVLTGGPLVDAIWHRLLHRAGARPGLPLTEDADLHLRVDGVRLNACRRSGEWHVFALPRVPGSLRIMSRAACPQELGIARDPRCLGVAIREILVRDGARRCRKISAADPMLSDGFHRFEPGDGLRWTDGDAVLPSSMFADLPASFELLLRVGGGTRYPDRGARAA